MKTWRPHRFPPLSLAVAAHATPGSHARDSQDALADGFQQGMERGWREGYDSGFAQARAEGMAQGLHEGQAQGQADGHAEALARWAHLAAPVDAALAALHKVQDDYQQALRRELVDLVAKVARQVIRCELTLQPLQLLQLVEETLAGMPPVATGVEVYLNPMDLERIRDLDPQRASQWSLLADARLDVGECRVRAGGQEADAGCRQRLQACMAQIGAQVLGADDETPATQEVPA